MISYFLKKILFKKREEFFHPAQKIKYLISLVLSILFLFRINLLGLFSPFTILYRGFIPIFHLFFSLIHTLNKFVDIFAIDRLFYWFQENIAYFSPLKYKYAFLNTAFLFTILILNLFATRFWCRFICPWGGFLGFISRKSLLSIYQGDNCKNCLECIRNCQGACNPRLRGKWIKQECLFCMHCLNCQEGNLKLITPFSKSRLNRFSFQKVDFGKRQLISTIGGAVLAYPLFKLSLHKKNYSLAVIRPPGALEEQKFINQCIRCHACINICPTHFLQPALFAGGIAGIFTPYGDGDFGYCRYDCNLCGEVCPVGAIRKLSLSEKKNFKIGTAFIDKSRCFVYSQGKDCLNCYRSCPVSGKAIVFRKIEEGLYAPEIIPEQCIGCSLCKYICPAKAIKVQAHTSRGNR